MSTEPGTLQIGEVHPSAHSAYNYIKYYIIHPIKYAMLTEALASCALSGNRKAEICYETLQRICKGEQVSDRYILGLAWFIRDIEEDNKE